MLYLVVTAGNSIKTYGVYRYGQSIQSKPFSIYLYKTVTRQICYWLYDRRYNIQLSKLNARKITVYKIVVCIFIMLNTHNYLQYAVTIKAFKNLKYIIRIYIIDMQRYCQ